MIASIAALLGLYGNKSALMGIEPILPCLAKPLGCNCTHMRQISDFKLHYCILKNKQIAEQTGKHYCVWHTTIKADKLKHHYFKLTGRKHL